MFAKIFQKNTTRRPIPPPVAPQDRSIVAPGVSSPRADKCQDNPPSWSLVGKDIAPRVTVHYGIPSTSSVLAFDPIQSLLAVATLDGRIKVFGGDGIEGLLVSPKQLPFKYMQFFQNQGFLVSITGENEIQVWDLDQRRIASFIQWESNLTAYSTIMGSSFMYIGDEFGIVSVLHYRSGDQTLEILPYYIPTDSIADALGSSSLIQQPVVGLLPQPSSNGMRLLIAYQDGVIILWDVSEDKVVELKRNNDVHIKGTVITDFVKSENKLSDAKSEYEEEKEISSLCWISSDGSILAVGYVDGDILLWNGWGSRTGTGQTSENAIGVIKLQLSTNTRKLPVIVLNWSANLTSSDCSGQLFVYGGDAIGSEEVLTILSLGGSSGFDKVECLSRVNLTLHGSFADMILLPSVETSGHMHALILTNPGQLHYYDETSLSSVVSQDLRSNYVPSVPYPMVIPTIEPFLSSSKLVDVKDGSFSSSFFKKFSGVRHSVAQALEVWPLSGGVPSQLASLEDYQIERIAVCGYRDGSIRMWDATFPVYSPICVIKAEVKASDDAKQVASISAMEFCSTTLMLAVGNDLGMVHLYKLIGSQTSVTEKDDESILQKNDFPQQTSTISIVESAVCALCFAKSGKQLAVGFKCCHVAMVDVRTSVVLFLVDSLQSIPIKFFPIEESYSRDHRDSDSSIVEVEIEDKLIIVTLDANFFVVSASTGSQIAVHELQKDAVVTSVDFILFSCETLTGSYPKENLHSCEDGASIERVDRSLIILCCTNALHLYSLKSSKMVEVKFVRSVVFEQTCCWATTFQKDDKAYGLVLLYESGLMEIRSLPNLEVIGESSLMKLLRWNYKTSMEKTLCSLHNGQIMMVNGCEFASMSLLSCENDMRIPESLPSFHEKGIASAPHLQCSPSTPKKIQMDGSRILGGLVKGLKKKKAKHALKPSVVDFKRLETIFSSPPFLKSRIFDDKEDTVELNIDDIDIDGPIVISPIPEPSPSSSGLKGFESEKDKLFEGASSDSRPKLRTAEEIRAKYRKEDPSTAAAHARDKLLERQEKLERLSLRTQELQSGAENFASMANELVKQMEKRKWWNI